MIGIGVDIGGDIIDGVLTCIFVNDNVYGGNDDVSDGTNVDDDGNVNLGIELGKRGH